MLTVQGKDPGVGDVLRTKRGANFNELDQAVGAAITAYADAAGLDPDDPDDGLITDVIDALSEIDEGAEDKGLLQSALDALASAVKGAGAVMQAVQRAQDVLSRYSGHTGYGRSDEPFGRRDRAAESLETKAGKVKF
jgi:hypothetical protein